MAVEIPAYEYVAARDLLERALAAGRTPLLVALDQITDPHNLGAVLRSAGAFGADGVVIGERRSVGVNATVWKVSAGAAARVPVTRETNLVRTLTALKKEGYFIVGLDGRSEGVVEDLALADSPLSWSPGRRAPGFCAWCARPATRSCRSPSPGPWSPSTPPSPPGSACTRSTGCGAGPARGGTESRRRTTTSK